MASSPRKQYSSQPREPRIVQEMIVFVGGKVARVRRYLYTCPLDYAKWATHYGLHQYNTNCTALQDSSWARCPQLEGHWKKKKREEDDCVRSEFGVNACCPDKDVKCEDFVKAEKLLNIWISSNCSIKTLYLLLTNPSTFAIDHIEKTLSQIFTNEINLLVHFLACCFRDDKQPSYNKIDFGTYG
jgi:hypothetical protein